MKPALLLLPVLFLTLATVPSCRKKTIGDKVDDVLDQRPGEKIRDAVEDATK